MSIHKRSVRVGVLLAVLCALLITWAIGIRSGQGSIARAEVDNWTTPAAARQGIRLLETRDPSGPPAYTADMGDLLFFTNSGVSYASLNTRNSVVVINAKTKQPIAVSDIDPAYAHKGISHGIAVSPDGKYVYLPNIAPVGAEKPSSVLVLDAKTLKLHQVIASGGPPHHVKEIQDASGRQWILVEDFNWAGLPWAGKGKGFYVLDPLDNNKVVTGMLPDDFLGMPYVGFSTPDGKYSYFSMPPPSFRELIPFVDGVLAKVDMTTMRVAQYIPMDHYPLWTVFTRDGKWAWITNSEDSKVLKIQRATAPGQKDKVVAEVATGPGPYGLRMNIDDTELWVADKGETLPGQRGTTLTVIDTAKNEVKRTLQTNCITNDHIIISPDGKEMWATCNQSHEIVVLDTATYSIKTRIPMPNNGDSHGGVFVAYWPYYPTLGGSGNPPRAEVVSDQNGLQGTYKAYWENYFRR